MKVDAENAAEQKGVTNDSKDLEEVAVEAANKLASKDSKTDSEVEETQDQGKQKPENGTDTDDSEDEDSEKGEDDGDGIPKGYHNDPNWQRIMAKRREAETKSEELAETNAQLEAKIAELESGKSTDKDDETEEEMSIEGKTLKEITREVKEKLKEEAERDAQEIAEAEGKLREELIDIRDELGEDEFGRFKEFAAEFVKLAPEVESLATINNAFKSFVLKGENNADGDEKKDSTKKKPGVPTKKASVAKKAVKPMRGNSLVDIAFMAAKDYENK